ncbi:hypothetical protein F383_15081 [Gossypium arboreum]|uniref:Uncharacterized protein n=1 Tax=Gossypium arboreum TaxID=29729 RepID=A0A0B0PWA1_GOSAR|nr:hypothetical protein F383_15081 [Gossypium arboreum]
MKHKCCFGSNLNFSDQ